MGNIREKCNIKPKAMTETQNDLYKSNFLLIMLQNALTLMPTLFSQDCKRLNICKTIHIFV